MSLQYARMNLRAHEPPCTLHAKTFCGQCYQSVMDTVERSSVVVMPNFLSAADVDLCIEAAAVWPHLCGLCEQYGGPMAGALAPELEGFAHVVAFTRDHIMLNLHRERFLQETFLDGHLCKLIVAAIARSQPTDWGVPPASQLSVRCIELHTYSVGGELADPTHRDLGSVISASILLSEPDDVSGGHFTTYGEHGAPVPHLLSGRGDAVVFRSEKVHGVSTITRGLRQSLVIELWTGQPCNETRFK